ncbi:hypothetical protein BsWGS_08603 [Bradybaena similaris]
MADSERQSLLPASEWRDTRRQPLLPVSEWENTGRQPLQPASERGNSDAKVHITFEDMGIPTTRRLHLTIVGETRPCGDIGLTDRVYIALVLLSSTAAAIPTICQLYTIEAQPRDYSFCSVLLVNTVFCVWYILEGIMKERPSEIAVLTLSTVVNMTFLAVNYTASYQSRLITARLALNAVFCPPLVILGVIVAWTYYVSRRLIFRTVGANSSLQAFYITLLIFQDLLKFDLQLGISSILFAVTFALPMTSQDITLLSVGCTFAVAWTVLGLWAMPRESRIGAYFFLLLSSVHIAYLANRLLAENTQRNSTDFACYVAALTLHLAVVLTATIVFIRFGKGLKDKLNVKQSVRSLQVRWVS